MNRERRSSLLLTGRNGVWFEDQTHYDFSISRVGMSVQYRGEGDEKRMWACGEQSLELKAENEAAEPTLIRVSVQEEIPISNLTDAAPFFGACLYEPGNAKFPTSINVTLTPQAYAALKETCFDLGRTGQLKVFVHVLKARDPSGKEFAVVTDFHVRHNLDLGEPA